MHAEDAGFDAVMVSEHVVLGQDAGADGLPSNPRDYALPGNQDPAMPWPSSLVLLSAVAAATTRLRLVAGAIIPPLRHPLLLAKDLATLDLLSEGRLVVQPTGSWHRSEYDAVGVPFGSRGALLDEHLAAWEVLWRDTPASFEGTHYRFQTCSWNRSRSAPGPVWFGAVAPRPVDPPHRKVRTRLQPARGLIPEDISRLRHDGRFGQSIEGAETGRTRGASRCVERADRNARPIPRADHAGFTSICIKPSQFIDDADRLSAFCREVVDRVSALVG
jgi:hypothetical protein